MFKLFLHVDPKITVLGIYHQNNQDLGQSLATMMSITKLFIKPNMEQPKCLLEDKLGSNEETVYIHTIDTM